MAGASCFNCIYSVCDPELWQRWIYMGWSIIPQCANHPCWPGQLRDVTGTPCRNYRRKPTAPGGDVRLIPLAEGSYAYVDAADYEWLSQWKWHLCSGYAARHDKGKTVLMHRMIMQPPKGMLVDHADGNRSNNCRFNLRVCTRGENQRNLRKHRGSRSQFKGVYYDKRRDKIYAQYSFEGKVRRLGCFENEVDAARAYDYAVVGAFGEFARLNFPQEWPPERRAQVRAQWLDTMRKERKKAKRTGGKRRSETTRRAKVRKQREQKPGGKKIKPHARPARPGASKGS